MITFKQFEDGLVSSDEFYSQFVTNKVKNFVSQRIHSKYKNLNEVPAFYWDELHLYISTVTKELQKEANMTTNLMYNSDIIAKLAFKLLDKESIS